jgi:hypothetical protein
VDAEQKLLQFENQLRKEAAATFPKFSLSVTERRRYFLKIRIEFGQETFVDVFYNPKNDRTDLALIHNNRRIFGYDNLAGWHRHPADDPANHVPCAEPALGQVFLEMRDLLPVKG